MTGISIGSSNNTTGLMTGLGNDSFEENKTAEVGRRSWFGGGADSKSSSMALAAATSMASSAASATAGAIVTGAKAAKTAVVDRRTSLPAKIEVNTDNNNASMWKKLSWSKQNNNNNNNNNNDDAIDQDDAEETPSWTMASLGGLTVGGNSDYGESDHLETTRRQSLSEAWNKARPKFRRRNTSPTIFIDHKTAHLSLYEGLLSTPPSTITFVIRRRKNIASRTPKTLRDLLGVRLVKSESTNHRFHVVREDGEDHAETENESTKDESSQLPPLLPPDLTVLLRPGDFLEAVDGIPVGGKRRRLTMNKNRCWDEEDLYNAILAETEHNNDDDDKIQNNTENENATTGQAVVRETEGETDESSSCSYPTTTLTFVCGGIASEAESPTPEPLESSTTSSPSPSLTTSSIDVSSEKEASLQTTPKPATVALPTVHKAYFLDQNGGNDLESGILDDFLTLKTAQKSIIDKTSRFRQNSAQSPTNQNVVGTSLLHIGSIPENHWLGKQSKIKSGDILLCADNTPCYNGELAPGDLSLVWRTALMTKVLDDKKGASYAGITVCTVPPTRMESIRKTAVAATGGALVGTGAVLMVTPLHPVGHAMAIGGLGVLGTEFEAPKKAFNKAKQSAANLAARVKKPQNTSSTGKGNEEDSAPEVEDQSSA